MVKTMKEFTEQQLANWKDYERVRRNGKYNMLDPRARLKSGLDQDTYMFCLTNYTKLKEAYNSSFVTKA